MPRFAVLEHTGAPDDAAGRHYDLLLEMAGGCRTWRLGELPQPGGPAVAAVELPVHRLAWLDHEAGEVSGNRGFVRRVDAGTYVEPPPASGEVAGPGTVAVVLRGDRISGRLVLVVRDDRWLAGISVASSMAGGGGYHSRPPEGAP